MKLITFGSLALVAAATANALSDCILSCQQSEAESSGCGSNYNTTLCMCSADFATNVKACLYENACNSDVNTFYTARYSFCDGDVESTDSTSGTTSETDGELGSCILACQASVASDAGCGSNYNETSCYCDNEDFATDVKVCLYKNCSSYVSVFYNYRSSVCGTTNSSEYYSSLTAGDPTAGLASASSSLAATTAASTATSESSPSSTADSGVDRQATVVAWGLGLVAIVLSYNMLQL